MGLDGRFGHVQLVGDLLVQQTIANHGQHAELLRRQAGQAGAGGFGFVTDIGYVLNIARPPHVTIENGPHRLLDGFKRTGLWNETAGAELARARNDRCVFLR